MTDARKADKRPTHPVTDRERELIEALKDARDPAFTRLNFPAEEDMEDFLLTLLEGFQAEVGATTDEQAFAFKAGVRAALGKSQP